MPQIHGRPLEAGPYPATVFDVWFMPFFFWANWWSLWEEALHVAHVHPHRADASETPAPLEDAEGLVA